MDNFDRLRAGRKRREVVRMVEIASEAGLPDDRAGNRRATRFAVGMRLDVTKYPEEDGAQWPAGMHNISETGLSFWSKQKLTAGDAVHVREFSGDNSSIWLSGRVSHCTVGIRGFLVGAEFQV